MELRTTDTEKSILKAAETLFLKHGYSKTSTAEIAKKARCNSALIHYYFRTKANLFLSIFKHKFNELIENFLNIELEHLTFDEKLRKIIETHFEFIRKNERFPFMLINELSTNPSTVMVLRAEMTTQAAGVISILQATIDEEVAAGRIRGTTAFDLILNMVSLNAVTYVALPILVEIGAVEREPFLENRKEEIVQTIINSLKI